MDRMSAATLFILAGLIGLPIGVGIWLGLGAGVTLACVVLIVIGFAVGYDAYVERQKAAK